MKYKGSAIKIALINLEFEEKPHREPLDLILEWELQRRRELLESILLMRDKEK